MSRALGDQARRLVPALDWVPRYERSWLRHDVVAGLVVAVILVPQAMAYAALAGMPPVTGLYAAIVALLVYALLGTSSHLAFGPFAVVSLLTAAALAPLAAGETARYVALAAVLALIVGGIQIALAAVRAGAIVNLISHPVISGFTSGAAVIIALSQVRDLLGIDLAHSTQAVAVLGDVVARVSEANAPTVLIGLASLAVMGAGRRVVRRVPWALLVAAVATAAAWGLRLDEAGVAVVGVVPAGLPGVSVPPLSLELLGRLWVSGLTIALIAYAANMSIAKAIALRTRERVRPNQELLASGTANAASGVFGGFPVAGSFTRTAVAYDAGARTQLAGVVAAAVIVAVVLFATEAFYFLPRAVLAAIVIVAAAGLVDLRTARETFRASRVDGILLAATFAATLLIGVEAGLLAGIGLTVVTFVLRRTRPHLPELGRVHATALFRNISRYPTVTDPTVAILRLDAPLDFLSADAVLNRVLRLTAERSGLRAIVLDASALTELDATGIHTLNGLLGDLDEAGVALVLATVRGPVRDRLARTGDWQAGLAARCHPDIDAALAALGLPAEHPLRRPDPTESRPPE